jgi:thioredoxin-like negative regulator of GroEL
MPLQLRVGLILLLLATVLSAFGYDPFAAFISGGGQYTLVSIIGCMLLFLVGRRSCYLEQQLATATTHLHTAEAQTQTLSSRLEALSSETAQLSEQLASLRLAVTQQEVLAPARLMLTQGGHAEAVKLLQEAVESQPDSVEINWLLGESMFQNKQYIEAMPHLLAGLLGGDVRRLSIVAQCEQTLGLYAEAEAHLHQLISVRGGEPKQEDLLMLAAVQRQLEPERAKETLEQVLALNPYNSVARYQLIELETESGAYESAIDLATEGLERNTADVGCFVRKHIFGADTAKTRSVFSMIWQPHRLVTAKTTISIVYAGRYNSGVRATCGIRLRANKNCMKRLSRTRTAWQMCRLNSMPICSLLQVVFCYN